MVQRWWSSTKKNTCMWMGCNVSKCLLNLLGLRVFRPKIHTGLSSCPPSFTVNPRARSASSYFIFILVFEHCGRVYYRALVHFVRFVHLLWVLSAFTLPVPAELSALKVPGWRTRNGEKMKWKTMVTTRTKRAPSWLRSGKGGALSAAFHKKSTFILAGLVSRVSRADLRPSLPP